MCAHKDICNCSHKRAYRKETSINSHSHSLDNSDDSEYFPINRISEIFLVTF